MERTEEDVVDFEVKLDTYDVVIWVDIPHFSTPDHCNCKESCNGVIKSGKGQPENSFNIFSLFTHIMFYPNGTPYEYKGYVSTLFDVVFEHKHITLGLRSISLSGTLTVVDADGKPKHPQTLGWECDIYREIGEKGVLYHEIGFPTFMSRKYLLSNSKSFLPNDTLTIRCDITFRLEGIVNKISFLSEELFYRQDSDEQWFHHEIIHDEKTGENCVKHSLKLSDPHSPLNIRLRQKSTYFRSLFRTSLKETTTQLLPIQDDEYKAFYNMIAYVRYNSLDHLCSLEDCAELYVVADKYDVEGLVKCCGQYMKKNIKNENAAELLMFCDVYKDKKMKEYAIQFILANWYHVKLSESWKILEEERSDLIREIICVSEENHGDVLLRDNECLKAFKQEMVCYAAFPKYRRTKSQSEGSFSDKYEKISRSRKERFQHAESEEQWFVHESEYDESIGKYSVKHSLNLTNQKSPLYQQLQQKSPYFQKLALEGKTQLMRIEEEEYHGFYNMICYVRFSALDHICSMDECFDLYVDGNKYEIEGMDEDCRDFMKNHLKYDAAADLLMFSDRYKDVKLKGIATEYILTNWFKVRDTDGWKFIEEERQDLIREMLLFIEKDDKNFLTENNECLEVFKKEMKCYNTILKNPLTEDASTRELAFFNLLTISNQKIVIGFLWKKIYTAHKCAKSLGYLESMDSSRSPSPYLPLLRMSSTPLQQENLVREVMRFIKRDFPKYFLTRNCCFQAFKIAMEELSEATPREMIGISANLFESIDVCIDDRTQQYLVQCLLNKWFEVSSPDDWESIRAMEENDEENEEFQVDEGMEKFCALFNKNIGIDEPRRFLEDLDFNDISSLKSQIVIIEFILANWNEEILHEFIKLAMEAQLNLCKQLLFVCEKDKQLRDINEDISRKFEDKGNHPEDFNFYQ